MGAKVALGAQSDFAYELNYSFRTCLTLASIAVKLLNRQSPQVIPKGAKRACTKMIDLVNIDMDNKSSAPLAPPLRPLR